jgi:MoaA/NifB/PqqE/SkfB family radical SAM enzyme
VRPRSIDVYLTYRCDMRCSHCFMGNLLDGNTDFDRRSLEKLVQVAATEWGVSDVTFLGGEPTLYPRLTDLVELVQGLGMRVRLVSNGGLALQRVLPSLRDVHIGISLDGSTAATHDAIRKRGSFVRVVESLRRAGASGLNTSGILSVSRLNLTEVPDALRLLEAEGCEYTNVHYVSARGNGARRDELTAVEWLGLRERLAAMRWSMPIRFESTFSHKKPSCLAAKGESQMFFPDGRVFACSMFVDVPNGHSWTWDGGRLTDADLAPDLARSSGRGHCPAAAMVSSSLLAEADSSGTVVGCIFDKELVNSSVGQNEGMAVAR